MMQITATKTLLTKKIATFAPQRGFSLIVTVTMMILLSLIAVGLLGLSSTVLRSSQSDNDMLKARANARLGLQLALGELQRTMGPDTRISANGAILDGQRSVNPSKQQIAGAWNAWKIDPLDIGTYQRRKSGSPENESSSSGATVPRGGFYRWLTSSQDPLAAEEIDYIASVPSRTTTLVPSFGADSEAVEAETVSLTDNGKEDGRFAWAVFDEGQKASLSAYADPEILTNFESSETANLQTEPTWANVEEWSSLATLEEDKRPKLISQQTLDFADIQNPERFYHDITPYSSSVLSNVIDGGLKTDLSLLFADETLPAQYQDRHLYSNEEVPIVGIPSRGRHPYTLPSPDPKWSLLHDYYRIPLDLFDDPKKPTITFNASGGRSRTPSTIPMRLTSMRTNDEYHEKIKIAPVISKAQFIFSLTMARGAALNRAWNSDNSPRGRNGSRWKSQLLMIIDPVITLWNPYDVPIDVNQFRIFLYRMPVSFKFTSSNPNFFNPPNYTDFTLAVGTGANQNTAYAYPLSILPEVGKSTILLQPGEHRVFSAHDYQTVWAVGKAETAAGKAIEMRPGWYPPGTRGRNAQYTGGLSTENICKTPNQTASAAFKNDKGQRVGATTILLEGNETISISVKPSDSDTAAATFRSLGNQSSDFYLRYGAWVEDGQIRAGEQEHLSDFGAIELNYNDKLEDRDLFPEFRSGVDLPTFPINPRDPLLAPVDSGQTNRNGHRYSPAPRGTVLKKPFLMATLHLKDLVGTSYTSKFPAKAWIHNNPTALYASAGFGGDEADLSAQQYEFSYQPLQGSWDNGVPEISGERHQGFGGPAPDAENGRPFAPAVSLPRTRLTSLAQFRHAPLNQTGKHPLQSQVAGNSFAHPMLRADEIVNEQRLYLDHSFLANQTLFDTTFFSTAEDADDFRDFVADPEAKPLAEGRYQVVTSGAEGEADEVLSDSSLPYHNAASLLMMKGGFNVNSTSVEAWRVFLSGLNQAQIPLLTTLEENTLGSIDNADRNAHVTRYQLPLEESLGSVLDPFGAENQFAWKGYRRLEAGEIEDLAEKIVEQVKARGPFQSLGEFVNRRAEASSNLSLSGALQTAIDNSNINQEANNTEHLNITGSEPGSDDYEYREAAAGNSLTGTPGYLMQGDLLQPMAPYLNVRSDTFKIRSYGSSLDKSGRVTAQAWCEAIVQRTPEYLDPTNQPHEFPNGLGGSGDTELSETNQKFGRRFQIISFRWLNEPSTTAA